MNGTLPRILYIMGMTRYCERGSELGKILCKNVEYFLRSLVWISSTVRAINSENLHRELLGAVKIVEKLVFCQLLILLVCHCASDFHQNQGFNYFLS